MTERRDSATRMHLSPPPTRAYSFPKSKIKVLLLENIHQNAVRNFESEGFQVEHMTKSLGEDELVEKIADVHVIGIRSKTKITARVAEAAKKLLCVGCFCIGTNQVDLDATAARGIPVFNAPFANSRSVAELILGEIIMLARQVCDRSSEMHQGQWKKTSKGCHEVRGKVLGIVGYGHIGSQLSVLAEGVGLKVVWYDVGKIMAHGNSQPLSSLEAVLASADFVTLHVPDLPSTRNMIGAEQFAQMKKGAYFLNASRGTVVDIPALAEAVRTGHLAGAAVDVYPGEPKANGPWKVELQGLPNVILTPHIGGATEEAQATIGTEVSDTLMSHVNEGLTLGAVNFPETNVNYGGDKTHRILLVHKNEPGVMRHVNNLLSTTNISQQVLNTSGDIGYLIVDVDAEASAEVMDTLRTAPYTIRTRVLY